MISTRGHKSPKYAVGERVLCYEPDESKARVLYDSKVLDIDWTRDDGGKRVPEYLVHFTGWNSSWDRWAPEDFILEYTEENADLQETLQQEAMEKLNTKKKRKKKMTISELVKEAKRKKRGDSSSRSANSSTGDSDDSDDSSGDEYEWQPKEVPINLPEPLRAKLEDDCYFISYKYQLIKLPCQPTILTVLESYVKYFATKHSPQEIIYPPTVLGGLTGMAKEPIPPPPLPLHNAELVKEVMDGIRVLFDFTIGTNLLYATEKDQFAKEAAACYLPGYKAPEIPVKRGRGRPPKHPKTPSPPVLEPQEKVEFSRTKPLSSPEESDVKDEDKKEEVEEKEEPPTRRITRRLSCNSMNNPAVSSSDTDSKRLRSESGSRSSQSGVKTRSESVTSDSSGGHPTPRPGLRHSARLSSTSAPPEITREVMLPSPRERKKSEPDIEKPPANDKSGHKEKPDSPKDKSEQNNNKGSENNKQNGKGKAANSATNHNGVNGSAGNKNTFSCKLLAEDANYAGRKPPVMIYGAQHLLRLFVKLPDILGKMDLPPKKLKVLVKHLELFLKYLSAPEQLEAFFPDSAYVDATVAYSRTKKK